MEVDEIIRKVYGIIRTHLSEEYRIYLFGSWAKGNALPFSDLDRGILGPTQVPWDVMSRILNEIDDLHTLRSVDAVDLTSVGETFRNTVLASGVPLTDERVSSLI